MTIRQTTLTIGIWLSLLCASGVAAAQGAPPPPPPAPATAPPATQPGMPLAAPPVQPFPPPGAAPPMGQAPYAAPAQPGQPYYPPLPIFGPSRLPYHEGDTVPPGYQISTRPNSRMISAGLATFAPLYGLSALWAGVFMGSENSRENFVPLLIPCIGPFITIGTSDSEDIGTFTLLLDGAGQLTGAALIIAGLLKEDKYLERTIAFDPRPEVMVGPRSAALRWTF